MYVFAEMSCVSERSGWVWELLAGAQEGRGTDGRMVRDPEKVEVKYI